MTKEKKQLQTIINKKIKAAKAQGIKVIEYSAYKIILENPISKNKNDKNTAFAGSIFSIAALAGWGFLLLSFLNKGIEVNVALYKSEVIFHKPVKKDFIAELSIKNEKKITNFVKNVIDKGKDKISFEISIRHSDEKELKAEVKALYSVIKKRGSLS